MYLKNRIIIFFFISLFRFVFYFFPSIFFISVYFVLSFIFFLPFSSYQSISFCFRWFRWFRFISFSFRWFRFVSFRFCWFRFVSFSLISFRFVSFRFRWFRFYFVSHFIGAHITMCVDLIKSMNLKFPRTMENILDLTKNQTLQITSHSCYQWIFRLMRKMMPYLLYIGYQTFTKIHIQKGIMPVLLLVEQKNCLYVSLTLCLQSEGD